MNDIFYRTKGLDKSTRLEIIKWAYEHNTVWWVDKLDCKISWSRQKQEMPIDEILGMYQTNDKFDHFVVILRHFGGEAPKYGEIGFRIGDTIDHFLFIHISAEDLKILVEQFNLEEM